MKDSEIIEGYIKAECPQCFLWDIAAKDAGYYHGMCSDCFDKNYFSLNLPNQPK